MTTLLAAGGLVAFLGPKPSEEFPLAELVPDDALFYAGFRDWRRYEEVLSAFPGAWKEETRKRFEDAKPHLAGGTAFYVDAKGDWVWLGRLTRAASLLTGVETVGDAAVIAETVPALERFRARKGALRDLPAFRQLRSRCFLNLESFDLPGRWADWSAVGFDLEPGTPWTARGRIVYRSDRFRLYVERYVQAPRHAGPSEGRAPLDLSLTDPFLRLWDELVEELDSESRELLEREMQILRRDLLGGQDVREFLARLGPRWGFSAVPTPHGAPALVAWLDLPDEAAREKLEKLLERAAQDWKRLLLGRNQAPWVEVEKKDAFWRLHFPWQKSLRLGEAFAPAYTFSENRFVFATFAGALPAPDAKGGDAHAALDLRIPAALDLLRSAGPFLSDRTFIREAEGMAFARDLREFNPVRLAALAREKPNPVERTMYLATRRAEFLAEALAEIAKGPKYKEELARREALVATLSERLSRFERVAATGRFTGEGLEFELRAWPRAN